jgi:hypothetical protein
LLKKLTIKKTKLGVKNMTSKLNVIKQFSATAAGKIGVGNIFVLICFLVFSGTTLFAQEMSIKAKHRQDLYPAVPNLFGGAMGIERVAHRASPVYAHHPVYTSEGCC